MTGPPLPEVRVVAAGASIAVAHAARVFADLGADVVVVESAGGHPLRRHPPFLAARPDASALAASYLAGMRSVTAETTTVRSVLAGADVVLYDETGPVGAIDAARDELGGLIAVHVSSFGRSGPFADDPGGDLLVWAASGLLTLVATDPASGPVVPVRLRGELTSVFAGGHAVIAALGALHARLIDGFGDAIEVSALESTVRTMATALPIVSYTGLVPVAGGVRGVIPWGIYHCLGGDVLVQCTEDAQWRTLVDLLGQPDWAAVELFETTAGRIEGADVVEALVSEAMTHLDAEEFLRLARERALPACRLHAPEDVLAWEHLESRDSLRSVSIDGSELRAPGPPSRFDHVGTGRDTKFAPAPGADTATVLAEWTPRAQPTSQRAPAHERSPLAGVRVIDMTWVWAGPFAADQLAHLGADVVKIESRARVDVTRRLGPFVDEIPGVDRSGYFNQFNQGKRSICLDPTTREGQNLLARLIASSDAIVDNMRAGALDRMGFADDRLRELNRDIVAVSMTGFGESGPERDRVAYGSLIDALAGVTFTTGAVDGGPTEVPMSLPDPASGLEAAIATIAALYRARTGGGGADVEVSMLESWLAANPMGVLWQSATGAPPERNGTRDDLLCPHGAFPAQGERAWVAIVVHDDVQFAGLTEVLGQPALAHDPRFASVESRRAHELELEQIIADWTCSRPASEVVTLLSNAGVPARAARTVDEVLACPHLDAREFFVRLPHPEAGSRPLCGVPWRGMYTPMTATRAAPTLGEHTFEIASALLGLGPEEIDRLGTAGVLG